MCCCKFDHLLCMYDFFGNVMWCKLQCSLRLFGNHLSLLQTGRLLEYGSDSSYKSFLTQNILCVDTESVYFSAYLRWMQEHGGVIVNMVANMFNGWPGMR